MSTEQLANLNFCTTKAGLGVGTTSTLTTANASLYSIGGRAYAKAATADMATPTVDEETGLAFPAIQPGFAAAIVVGFDNAGALQAVQGPQVALSAAGALVSPPAFPQVPDDMAAVGYVIVAVTAAGAAWTMGVSNFAGPPADTTFTFDDVMVLPSRPQLS